jgi:hypothetical protein
LEPSNAEFKVIILLAVFSLHVCPNPQAPGSNLFTHSPPIVQQRCIVVGGGVSDSVQHVGAVDQKDARWARIPVKIAILDLRKRMSEGEEF